MVAWPLTQRLSGTTSLATRAGDFPGATFGVSGSSLCCPCVYPIQSALKKNPSPVLIPPRLTEEADCISCSLGNHSTFLQGGQSSESKSSSHILPPLLKQKLLVALPSKAPVPRQRPSSRGQGGGCFLGCFSRPGPGSALPPAPYKGLAGPDPHLHQTPHVSPASGSDGVGSLSLRSHPSGPAPPTTGTQGN